jgi:hypothetical protein
MDEKERALRGLFIIIPIAPSSECEQRKITVSLKIPSFMAGVASKIFPLRSFKSILNILVLSTYQS